MSRLDLLVSPYVGIVRSVDERLVGTADARLPTFTGELAPDDRLLGSSLSHVGTTCGMALDRDSAIAAALGEAAERYSLSYVPRERVIRASAAELGPAAPDPRRFGLFSPEQYGRPGFPFVPFDPDVEVPWIDGWRIATGEPAWLPAELVFLADPVEAGESRIGYATSSGAACADTREEAVVGGLLELCERDAFSITWWARLSLPLLDWSADPELAALDRAYFAPTGLRYAAVDLSAFHGLPSVLGVVRAPASETAVLGVGAGTAPTVERAWWKALSEAFGTRAAARARVPEHRALRDDGADVVGFDDHIVFHAGAERSGLAAFLDASVERVDVRSVDPLPVTCAAQLETLVDRLERAGLPAYAVELTAPDVAALGVRVVKTLVPGLCMLDAPHEGRFLGAERLRTVPCDLGYREEPIAPDELNPYPHPFP